MANNCYVIFPPGDSRNRKGGLSEEAAIELAGRCLNAIAYDAQGEKICRGTSGSLKKLENNKSKQVKKLF